MEELRLTQQELKILISVANHAFKSGGLGIGDVMNISPIIHKIDAKIKDEAAPTPAYPRIDNAKERQEAIKKEMEAAKAKAKAAN